MLLEAARSVGDTLCFSIFRTCKNYDMPSYGAFIYLLTDEQHVHLYTGRTTDLTRRMAQHLNERYEGYSKRYGLKKLVFYEPHSRIEYAQQREYQIKRWKRSKKEWLISLVNPGWDNLITESGDSETLPLIADLPIKYDTVEQRMLDKNGN